MTNPIPFRQRQRHNNNSGGNNNMTLSDQIMQGALNARKNNPPSSSASSDGNDEAAMAVIMSLLEVSIYNKVAIEDQSVLQYLLISGGCRSRWSSRFQRAALAPALENAAPMLRPMV